MWTLQGVDLKTATEEHSKAKWGSPCHPIWLMEEEGSENRLNPYSVPCTVLGTLCMSTQQFIPHSQPNYLHFTEEETEAWSS